MSKINECREDGSPMCECQVYEHCAICDPSAFSQKQKPMNAGRAEQEEATVFQTLMVAIEEHLKGFTFTTEQSVDEVTGELVVKITRVGAQNPCKIRINLEV